MWHNRRHFLKIQYLLALLIVGLDIYFLYDVFILSYGARDKLVLWVFLGSALLAHMMIVVPVMLGEKTLLKKADKADLGNYTAGEIQALVDEVLAALGERVKPNIYIVRSKEFNAMAVRSLLFRFFKSLNAIQIHTLTLHILSKEELRSTLTHEIAHYRWFHPPLARIYLAVFLFMALVIIECHHWFDLSLSWWYLPIGGAAGFFMMVIFGTTVSHKEHHDEYLADYTAAKAFGYMPVVHAILKMGMNTEFLEDLYRKILRRLGRNSRLPMEALDDIVEVAEEKLPNRIAGLDEVNALVKEIFQDPAIAKLKKTLSPEETKEKKKKLKELRAEYRLPRKMQVISWKDFDTRDKDGVLDEEEFDAMITELKRDRRVQLFKTADDSKEGTEDSSHPTFVNRLIYIHQSFMASGGGLESAPRS